MGYLQDCITAPYDIDEVLHKIHYSLHITGRPPKQHTSCSTLDRSLYTCASHILVNHLDQTPSLSELAKRCNTNNKRLNAAFKNCTGMTVFEYLREQRMLHAKSLLLNTSWSIYDIAQSVGFAKAGNFSTAFHKRYGNTPQQFRSSQAPISSLRPLPPSVHT